MEIYRIESDLFGCVGDAYDLNSTVLVRGEYSEPSVQAYRPQL